MLSRNNFRRNGFALIELSIVLVIIGLIVGGVLLGRDLISAAAVRAQISQIEKYQTAVKTFQLKYGYLPGDIPQSATQQFGFLPRWTGEGQGDGNGVLENSNPYNHCHPGALLNYCGSIGLVGELVLFWADLSTAGLIDGGFTKASAISYSGANPLSESSSPTTIKDYFPAARIGYGYIVVYSGGYTFGVNNGKNYFSTFSMNYWISQGGFSSTSNPLGDVIFTPKQAYLIDNKVDDGLPQFGKVTAMAGGIWAANRNNNPNFGGDCDDPLGVCGPVVAGDGIATDPTKSYNCYDNNNIAGATEQYSTNLASVENINCGLSWEFQ